MENKECKVTYDGVEVATVNCSADGVTIKCTEEGKTMYKESGPGCCG